MTRTYYWFIGIPGGVLTPLDPDPGIDRTLVRIGVVLTSLAGAATVQTRAMKRGWKLAFSLRTDAEADVLISFWDGRQGLGPFTFIDPLSAASTLVFIADCTDTSTHRGGDGPRNIAMTLQET